MRATFVDDVVINCGTIRRQVIAAPRCALYRAVDCAVDEDERIFFRDC
jgi:hypothetical protein